MQIYAVSASPGRLGISAMPGLGDAIAADAAAIAAWGARLVLTMTGEGEMERAGAPGLAPALARHGVAWRHLPVNDFGAPPPGVERRWPDAAAAAHAVLDAGGGVLVHCRAGCGRSGMAALRLLVERGEDPDAALARLRSVRDCAVETQRQFAWAAAGVARSA